MQLKQWFRRRVRSSESKNFAIVNGYGGVGPGLAPLALGYSADTPRRSSAVESAVRWALRTFPEPTIVIEKRGKKGWTIIPDHVAQVLMDHPSPPGSKMSRIHLMQQIVTNLMVDGNCYIEKLRGVQSGKVQALEVIPCTAVTVRSVSDAGNILSHYEVATNKGVKKIAPDDMIHIIDGVDPNVPIMGMSPFKALAREVSTDLQIARYQEAILRAPSFKGLLGSKGVPLTDDQGRLVADQLRRQGGGENAGGVVYVGTDITFQKTSLTPDEMALDQIPTWVEERISAVLGIPAVVLGLGAGLTRATFANFKEAREAAVEAYLIPMWTLVADALTNQLLPDIGGRPNERFRFDDTTVRALSEDEDRRHGRARENFEKNLWDRKTALVYIGDEPTPNDDGVYAYMLKTTPLGEFVNQVAKAKTSDVPK